MCADVLLRNYRSRCTVMTVVVFNWRLCTSGVCGRNNAVSWWDMGADAATLGQTDQRLLAQCRHLRHQQDPRHLRLHQVRPATQHEDTALQRSRGSACIGKSHGRYCHTPGKCLFCKRHRCSVGLLFVCRSRCRQNDVQRVFNRKLKLIFVRNHSKYALNVYRWAMNYRWSEVCWACL